MFYQTDMQSVNLEVLESVLYNAEKDISKIKLTLEFDDEEKYKRFMNKITPTLNEEEQVLNESDSEDDEDIISKSKGYGGFDQNLGMEKVSYVQELDKLETSIVLKENYQDKIKEIEKATGVKILIVPEKLKYFGPSQAAIDSALGKATDIKSNINISSVQRYGRQIYESSYCTKKLNDSGVRLGKVAQKYYYWYDQSESDKKVVENVIESIFVNKSHVFTPLFQKYEYYKRRFNNKYIDALVKTNAKLYEEFLQKQISDDPSFQYKAELNRARTDVIIHLPVIEQAEMFKHQIKKFFENLVQFFVHFNKEEIENVDLITKGLDANKVLWNLHEDLLVISYNTNPNFSTHNESSNETLVNETSVNESRESEFIESLRVIFDNNSDCKIEILSDQDKIEDENEEKQNPLYKKILIEHKKYDGIFIIIPKMFRTDTFLKIVKEYVLKPKLHKQTQVLDKSVQVSLLNNSSQINDTTTMIEPSFNRNQDNDEAEEIRGNRPILETLNDPKEDIRKTYKFFIEDQQGKSKYSNDADEIVEKKKAGLNEHLQQLLFNQTKRKYKTYPVIVSTDIKATLPETNDIVTVFMKESDKKNLKNGPIRIYFLSKTNKHLDQNGFLLNVSGSQIVEKDYKYEVPAASFEIIKYLKYLDKI